VRLHGGLHSDGLRKQFSRHLYFDHLGFPYVRFLLFGGYNFHHYSFFFLSMLDNVSTEMYFDMRMRAVPQPTRCVGYKTHMILQAWL
jgi:hypothetical protein